MRYKWKVYYDSTLLHEDEELWEDEEDAYDEAKSYIESKIQDYEVDGIEYDENIFDIEIIDEPDNTWNEPGCFIGICDYAGTAVEEDNEDDNM